MPEAARRASTTSTVARPRTWSPTCASSRRPPASCPPTRRWWSSASGTRSATGGCACSPRGAGACTPPGAWRSRPGSATSTSWRPTRSGPTTGSSSTSPTPTSRPPADLVLLEPDEIEDLVVRELGSSALFGARFRENAARALLIPRAYPGKRTPLWQQRLKAQSLLEVAKDFPRFPIVLETYRECLRDVLDLPGPGVAAARPLARAGSRWSRSRRRPRRRSPPRCSSTTSPPTCTRATPRTPSGARRRCRSIASCCASCSARRSCAS